MRHTGALKIIFWPRKLNYILAGMFNLTSKKIIFVNLLVSFVCIQVEFCANCLRFNAHILAAIGFRHFTAGILCSPVLA